MNHDEAARAWYTRCHELSEEQGRHEESLRVGRKALAQLDGRASAHPTALLMYSVAGDLVELERHEEALEAYAALVERFAEAEADAKIDELVAFALDGQAYVLQELGRPAEALAAADAAIARGDAGEVAHRRRAQALGALGRHDEAIETLRDALVRLADAEDVTAVKAALIDQLIAAGHHDQALIAIDGFLADAPEDLQDVSRALVRRGELLLQAERYEDGLEAYERLLTLLDGTEDFELRVRRAIALWNAAEALGALDRLDEAIAANEQLAAELAEDVEAVFAAMGVEFRGRDDPAARVMRAGLLAKEASVHAMLGDEAQAEAMFRELIDRCGDDDLPDVRRIVAQARELIEDDNVL